MVVQVTIERFEVSLGATEILISEAFEVFTSKVSCCRTLYKTKHTYRQTDK